MITVHAIIETIPPDNSGDDPNRQSREVQAEGETYEEARDRIFAELPEGWRVVWLRR